MRTVIVGCGRVGAGLAETLARAGHEVTIIDTHTEAFSRLEPDFPGTAIRGDGTDEDVLRRAGAEGIDWFFALTEGDNRNVLAAQLANDTLGAKNVVAKVNDPVRAQAYTSLGVATICRTTMLVDALLRHAGIGEPGAPPGVAAVTRDHAHELRARGNGRTPATGTAGAAGVSRAEPDAAGSRSPRRNMDQEA